MPLEFVDVQPIFWSNLNDAPVLTELASTVVAIAAGWSYVTATVEVPVQLLPSVSVTVYVVFAAGDTPVGF
jgi:hypothetical protein